MIIGDVLSFGGSGVLPKINVSGLLSTDSVVATMGSKSKSGKWKLKPNPASHNLPSGYTEVEYLESSGTQYIDTGINKSGGIEIKLNGLGNDYAMGLFLSTTNCAHYIYSNTSLHQQSCFNGNNAKLYGLTNQSSYENIDQTIRIDISNSTQSYNVSGQTGSGSYVSTTLAGNVYLFALNDLSESLITKTNYRVYYCKFYDDSGVIVHDYIPCKNSSNEYGLYDLVTNTFFENQGTGSFTGGSEVPQYIGYYQIDIDSFGLWSVTATSGVKTKTISVNVDTVREYDVEWDWKLYLYNQGDECESVTGGWTASGYTYSANDPTVTAGTKNSNNLYMSTITSSSEFTSGLGTANLIDVTNYSTLKIDNQVSKTSGLGVMLVTTKTNFVTNYVAYQEPTNTTRGICTIDISNLSGSYYIVIYSHGWTSANRYGYVYSVLLEE